MGLKGSCGKTTKKAACHIPKKACLSCKLRPSEQFLGRVRAQLTLVEKQPQQQLAAAG